MKNIFKLITLYVVILLGISMTCYGQDVQLNEETHSAWNQFDIEEATTHATISNKPILCGSQKAIIRLRSSMRIVDLKTRQSTYIPVKKLYWRASCSEDGRYVFLTGVDKTGGDYGLSYFDLGSGKEYQVFSSLQESIQSNFSKLVSPNSDYVIGPENIGSTVTLSGGKVLAVIPYSLVKEIDTHCGFSWSTDGSKLFYVLQSQPKMIDGRNQWKVIFRIFNLSTRTWSEVTTDYLNVESLQAACPDAFIYKDRFFYNSESMRYAPTGLHDVFEFGRDGNKLNIEKSWRDVSDFAVGRDGSIAFSQIHGVKYFYDGYELTTGKDIAFEVLFENENHRSYLTKEKIIKVSDIPGISFGIGRMHIGIVIDSFEGPVAVVNEFQPNFAYRATFYKQASH